jgi:hypothetical protein
VTTGDAAGQFFSGADGDRIMETFERYIEMEQDLKEAEAKK